MRVTIGDHPVDVMTIATEDGFWKTKWAVRVKSDLGADAVLGRGVTQNFSIPDEADRAATQAALLAIAKLPPDVGPYSDYE